MTLNKKVSFEELFPLIKQKIDEESEISFCAFGTSMLPFIHDGSDLVTLGPIRSPLKKNDIVFYRRANGQFVLHRIVKVKDTNTLLLCGDNQFVIEKDIHPQQIIARLVRLERDGRAISLSSPQAILWSCHLPIRRLALRIRSSLAIRCKRIFKKTL